MRAAPAAERALELGVAAVLGSWVAVTALSQHPNRTFDRFRRRDPLGVVIPNWRFFAPDPAVHDFRVLHRWLCADGTQTAWREPTVIPGRTWRQAFWFPDRRADKALIDVCGELVTYLQMPGLDLTTTPAYRLLRSFTRSSVAAATADDPAGPPRGFQFLVLRHTGHDEEPEPDYLFASRFEAWTEPAR